MTAPATRPEAIPATEAVGMGCAPIPRSADSGVGRPVGVSVGGVRVGGIIVVVLEVEGFVEEVVDVVLGKPCGGRPLWAGLLGRSPGRRVGWPLGRDVGTDVKVVRLGCLVLVLSPEVVVDWVDRCLVDVDSPSNTPGNTDSSP